MFEKLQITLFGTQPIAKIDRTILQRIIQREFGSQAYEVKQKLQKVKGTIEGKARVSAAIVKLADKDITAIDDLIKLSNNDFRDVLARAEYPRCFDLHSRELDKNKMQQIYLDDWKDYSNWLNKK